jgi:hypothetical protein
MVAGGSRTQHQLVTARGDCLLVGAAQLLVLLVWQREHADGVVQT